jgi:sulfur carrier protein
MTVDSLVAFKKLCPEKIVLEHNFHILSREDWPKVMLRDGDTVEIVSFVGGG